MPSHKHKKKKKNNKTKKKPISSDSSSDDDSMFKMAISQSESDDSKDEEILSSLVRRTYKNHLEEALSQNFEEWLKRKKMSHLSKQQLVHVSSCLEQKALKNCMISELYRKKMASLIKQIKQQTGEGKLCVGENFAYKFKLPSSKETQTEGFNKSVCAVETQTDELLSLSSKPYDPAIEFSDSQSSVANVSSSQPPQDVYNITSTSDDYASSKYFLGTKQIHTTEKYVNPLSELLSNTKTCENPLEKPPTTHSVLANCNNIADNKDFENNNAILSNNQETIKQLNSEESQFSFNINTAKNNLDARLTAMGLFDETENEVDCGNLGKPKKNNWYAEEIAQSCNFTRILLRMSTRQRERVIKKLKVLFGDEDEPLTELTEKNITICRKRIASIVVMELTPIYQSKRIASRHLFKFLAKKITKSLMEKSYAPDTRSIRWKVTEFFNDGRVIMAESDCD